MIYTPETHKTRCGAPWRDLDNSLIAVDRGGLIECLGSINKEGHFRHYCSCIRHNAYDLVPIPKEHDLPTDLPMTAQWAAKDGSGCIFAYNEKSKWSPAFGSWRYTTNSIQLLPWLYGTKMLADYPPEDSLHKRIKDGGWVWVPRGDR